MSEMLTVDDLTFEVRRSSRRTTLQITVDRDGDLIIAAPTDLAQAKIEGFIREKRGWVYRKLAEKEMLWKPQARREFVNGEGFPYLGRSYRLKLVERQDRPLKLVRGWYHLQRAEAARGRAHFVRWYTEHGRTWVERRLQPWSDRMNVQPAGLRILDLGHRWGSCSPSGTINFHWTTIQLPMTILDYVLVHELAHLREPTHGPAFWRLVERTMPDYAGRKQWLAEQGQAFAGI